MLRAAQTCLGSGSPQVGNGRCETAQNEYDEKNVPDRMVEETTPEEEYKDARDRFIALAQPEIGIDG